MIVYSEPKDRFLSDALSNQIHIKILSALETKLGKRVGESEIASWRNSMQFMSNILNDNRIPIGSVVSIEFNVPGTGKRIDLILTGKGPTGSNIAVIIELKQWSSVSATTRDGIVSTFLGRREVETVHPSYQAWSYATLISDFNYAVQAGGIELIPCAYLHNMDSSEVIKSPIYADLIAKAPCFISSEASLLKDFLSTRICAPDSDDIISAIENGELRPSKALSDCITNMLKGNEEFVMIDEQKLTFETALELADKAQAGNRITLIIRGGPGTGKSVVAINLLVELTKRGLACQYVSKNAAPRSVYSAKLKGSMTKSRIDNLFKGSGSYVDTPKMAWDVLIVDESHRLNEKSGLYGNQGENQIKELIHSAKLSIFFLDEDQRVTLKDIGSESEIRKWAEQQGSDVYQTELTSQFRCNGSDGYLAFLDNSLQIRETANVKISPTEYDFRVFDCPNSLHETITELNSNNKSRVVAGYCWDWKSKKDLKDYDIVIDEHSYAAQWNFSNDSTPWIISPNSIKQVGCIHTSQGLELDYVGVIIGADLVIRNGEVITDGAKRSNNDASIKGYKKLLKESPEEARSKADTIIKNTYKTLMTRGMKGCYIFSSDNETREYLRSKIQH